MDDVDGGHGNAIQGAVWVLIASAVFWATVSAVLIAVWIL